jgi:hypothetical protein
MAWDIQQVSLFYCMHRVVAAAKSYPMLNKTAMLMCPRRSTSFTLIPPHHPPPTPNHNQVPETFHRFHCKCFTACTEFWPPQELSHSWKRWRYYRPYVPEHRRSLNFQVRIQVFMAWDIQQVSLYFSMHKVLTTARLKSYPMLNKTAMLMCPRHVSCPNPPPQPIARDISQVSLYFCMHRVVTAAKSYPIVNKTAMLMCLLIMPGYLSFSSPDWNLLIQDIGHKVATLADTCMDMVQLTTATLSRIPWGVSDQFHQSINQWFFCFEICWIHFHQ